MYPRTDTAATSIYYTRTGNGPALVLLHGFPESGTLWKRVVNELSPHATLIVPDMPGAGNSPLSGEVSIDDMADFVKDVLDKEGIDKAIIAGHSMGGYIALAFAERHTARVAGISLVHSTPVGDDEEKKVMRQKSVELIRKGGKRVFVTQMIPNLFSDDFKAKKPEVVEECIDEAMKMSENGMVNFYQALIGRKDRVSILKDAPYPLQWIIGHNDNIMPYKKILQHCYHSGTNFVALYENCGHMSMYEAPAKLTDDLKNFIDYCYTRHQKL